MNRILNIDPDEWFVSSIRISYVLYFERIHMLNVTIAGVYKQRGNLLVSFELTACCFGGIIVPREQQLGPTMESAMVVC